VSPANVLLVLAMGAAVWGVVSGMLVVAAIRRRGAAVSFLWLRLVLPSHLHRCARITRLEEGRTGTLFNHYVIAFNIALLAALAALGLSAL
jgi:hypothetical protein